MDDIRETLDRLIRERGEDYASVSRLLGRNAAYVQQFIRRGVPRKLDEDDRRTLAGYFRVDEAALGGRAAVATGRRDAAALVPIRRLAVGASAGPGSIDTDGEARATGEFAMDRATLRALTPNVDAVQLIKVAGDSMAPTLDDGDDILVDRADAGDRLRDGIYVLRFDDALNVKRIARDPAGGRVTVRSDNPAYPAWPDCDLSLITIIGRVVWVGKRVA